MKKEDLVSLLVYAIMVAIALFVGVNIIAPAFQILSITGLNQYAYAIVTILLGFLLNVILLEVGHVLGGIAGGYEIKMVNVLGLALVKEDGVFKLGFRPFEGLTGETTIAPKAKKVRPKLYLWGGLVVYVLEIVFGLVIAYGFFMAEQWMRYGIVVAIAIGGMLMIYNFMPFKLETITDGYRLATLTTAKGNAAYDELQRIEKAYKLGQSPKPIQAFKELNSLSVQVYFHKIYQAIIDEDYVNAKKDLKKIEAYPRLGELLQQKVFILTTFIYFLEKTPASASKYFYGLTSKQRKYLANDSNMSTLSTYLYVAGLVEGSQSETSYTVERSRVALKKIHESGRKAAEAIMFDRVLKLVKKKHPTWRF
jgi:hypothetical protein